MGFKSWVRKILVGNPAVFCLENSTDRKTWRATVQQILKGVDMTGELSTLPEASIMQSLCILVIHFLNSPIERVKTRLCTLSHLQMRKLRSKGLSYFAPTVTSQGWRSLNLKPQRMAPEPHFLMNNNKVLNAH